MRITHKINPMAHEWNWYRHKTYLVEVVVGRFGITHSWSVTVCVCVTAHVILPVHTYTHSLFSLLSSLSLSLSFSLFLSLPRAHIHTYFWYTHTQCMLLSKENVLQMKNITPSDLSWYTINTHSRQIGTHNVSYTQSRYIHSHTHNTHTQPKVVQVSCRHKPIAAIILCVWILWGTCAWMWTCVCGVVCVCVCVRCVSLCVYVSVCVCVILCVVCMTNRTIS